MMNKSAYGCDIKINYNLDEKNNPLKHNYILFLDKNGNSRGKLVETNGWLLLEAVLAKSINESSVPYLEKSVSLFGRKDLAAWWPEAILKDGKEYFKGKKPIPLHHDPDDTAWIHRYYGDKVQEDLISGFLSEEPLPYPFDDACLEIECDQDYIVRLWDYIDWHDDIDIVSTADIITMLDINSSFGKEIFETNKQIINHIIENKNFDNYFKYFDPKVTGYFLLLYYDDQGPKILTEKSRTVLLEKLKKDLNELNNKPLVALWGGRQ